MSQVTEEKLPIPESEIVSHQDIADGVRGLRILFVNVYGVEHGDGTWTMIDAGLPKSAGEIREWAQRSYATPPHAIVLTHGHFDHAGAARELADVWNVPVYAHPLEMPFLTGREKYPPPHPGVGGGLMALLSPLYPSDRLDIGPRLQALPEDGSVPGLDGWRWLHTPGHTVGHVSLYREKDGALLVGDAFCTVKSESLMAIAKDDPELHGPPAYYTPDYGAAKASILKLAALSPRTLIPGHGRSISGDAVAGQLAEFAGRFEALAVPEAAK
jgi:glyoxylase-like metal-dependent hydrolase (beta-lactamase superfamily II)